MEKKRKEHKSQNTLSLSENFYLLFFLSHTPLFSLKSRVLLLLLFRSPSPLSWHRRRWDIWGQWLTKGSHLGYECQDLHLLFFQKRKEKESTVSWEFTPSTFFPIRFSRIPLQQLISFSKGNQFHQWQGVQLGFFMANCTPMVDSMIGSSDFLSGSCGLWTYNCRL